MGGAADIGERIFVEYRQWLLERLGPLGSVLHGNVFRAATVLLDPGISGIPEGRQRNRAPVTCGISELGVEGG